MKGKLKGFRKRILVNEMQLFNLYREVQEIRDAEYRATYAKQFRQLLKDAEFVNFTINPKKEGGTNGC